MCEISPLAWYLDTVYIVLPLGEGSGLRCRGVCMDTFCGAAPAPDKSDLFGGEADDTFRHPDPGAAEDDDEDILVVREGVVEFVG